MYSRTWKLACALWIIYTFGRTGNLKTPYYPSLTPPTLSISRSFFVFGSLFLTHIHKLTQTHSDFLYISLSIGSTPSPITMTLVLPTYFLSILSLSLPLPPAGFISGPAQCPTVMS